MLFSLVMLAGAITLIVYFVNKQRQRDKLQRQQTWYLEQTWRQSQGLRPTPPPGAPGRSATPREPGQRWTDDQIRPFT